VLDSHRINTRIHGLERDWVYNSKQARSQYVHVPLARNGGETKKGREIKALLLTLQQFFRDLQRYLSAAGLAPGWGIIGTPVTRRPALRSEF
jgi:HEPN domain-containing protein